MGDRGQRWRRDVHENSRRVRVAMMVRWLGSALDMVDMLQGGRGGCLSVLLVSRACVPEIDARAGVACSDQCMLLAHEICLVTERNAWAPACSRQAKVEASNSPIRPCSPGGDRPGTRASGDVTAARVRPGRVARCVRAAVQEVLFMQAEIECTSDTRGATMRPQPISYSARTPSVPWTYSITTTSTSPWSACNTDATFAQRMTLSRVSSSVGFSSCFQYVNVSMVPRCIQRRSSPSATAACFVSCTREQTVRRGTEREAAARMPAMVASRGVRCWTRSTV